MGLLRATVGALRRGLGRTRNAMGGSLARVLRGRRLDNETLEMIETYLLQADVGTTTTRELVSALRADAAAGQLERGEDAIDFLKAQLQEKLGAVTPLATTEAPPLVILVAGVNGVGKTTSVAKIAHALRQDGRSVLLAAADTFRAGAVAQLAIWGDRLGVDVVRGAEGADPAAVVWDAVEAAIARKVDVLLVDTAGRMHTEVGLMRQLTKIKDVLAKRIPGAPHEVLLVLDATQGQNAMVQAQRFSEAVDISGIFLAKLDGTARGGIMVPIARELGVPVKLVGLGERPEDVEPFDPAAFVDAIFADE
ncbi:MAG: signal recognition particle-docking protein FtsY [Planctomycetes bacterium]|nr:signal recognition particle-docking protein FtsY [Planctomycetota bacterium]MCP4837752.1 signal recognition particle-docking protein FtsY [Planctomycetota bacterium]